ncbi:CDP-glycerol glycerophosphotransferase family protein [Ciceribacter sp. RN22]|uniref:CDP-glycerol glycerophosphotransferase family protein n=1 Tax=Ciceribacter sp. RN22 TaxID=2954932 RepID=UPI00209253C1|nr:CDP-glycerol glycerophosphotransferase family protein [Ciceribacter sp. RN22]MCO6179017.1 CDP-glycerol glycerophosphotransferase family protein [Ciceribacter sp. RN22]
MYRKIKVLPKSLLDLAGMIERHVTRVSLALLLRLLGQRITELYFSYFPIVRRTRARFIWLHNKILERYGKEGADRFAMNYLCSRPRPQDYEIALASTGLDRPGEAAVAQALPRLVASSAKSADTSASFVSALVSRGDVDLALEVVEQYSGSANGKQAVDWSALLFSLVPHSLSDLNMESQPLGSTVNKKIGDSRNRLIVMDEELSPAAIKSLAKGARRLTLLQCNDLYGRIDLSSIQNEIPDCEIVVEHARSRVDRFHRRYFELHEKTLHAAEALSTRFIEGSPWLRQFLSDMQGFEKDLTFELSDKLFFKALRLESVRRAALDPDFDSVVVSFGDNFELYRLFFADARLWRDPRVKGCCRSRKIRTAVRYASRIAEMQRRAAVGSVAPVLDVIAAIEEREKTIDRDHVPGKVREYLEAATNVSQLVDTGKVADRPDVLFVAQEGRAYGYTAVQMATHLHARFNVDIVLTMGNVDRLRQTLATAQKDPYLRKENRGRQPSYMKLAAPAPNSAAKTAFCELFYLAVGPTVRGLLWESRDDQAVRCAIDFLLADGLPQTVLSTAANARAIAALFSRQQYSAVAISPIRTPRNQQFVTLAREAGIPSLAVEPHCLNAAYCRYGSVPSDYAAVYSEYFAEEYDRYFGIPKDRCYPFGSPRVLRPIGYDPVSSRREARRRIGLHDGDPPVIAVPTQPMPADHILAVWRMIIRAAKALDRPVRVILKPHPEEGPGHIDRYRQIIAEEDAGALCYVADLDIKDLLIASSLVLTTYSVTALEAAVLERNVVIVGRLDVPYPMEYDKILGVPFCRTEQETTAVIREALTLQDEARSAAREFRAENPYLFDNSTFENLTAAVEDVIAKGREGIRATDELPSSLFVTAPFREYLV